MIKSRMQKKYFEEVRPKLLKEGKYENIMATPMLKKIVISMGVAKIVKEKGAVQDHVKELSMIAGQKPIIVTSSKNISNFKLKEGQVVALKVTLRKKKMYDFFDRFCNLAVPRIRDFRGFDGSKGDGRGNYTLGLEDQQAFCEVNLDEVKRVQGMHITFVTSAKNDDDMRLLLTMMGFPFK
jgi:large subunit ribosomal protein L5